MDLAYKGPTAQPGIEVADSGAGSCFAPIKKTPFSLPVGRNKLAQLRQNSNKTMPELRKLVPAYEVAS
jgi:hypothetical protein